MRTPTPFTNIKAVDDEDSPIPPAEWAAAQVRALLSRYASGSVNKSFLRSYRFVPDPEHSFGELRLITYALAQDGRLLVISHTEKSGTIRIVRARIATSSERKRDET